jgi:hypothetical protein
MACLVEEFSYWLMNNHLRENLTDRRPLAIVKR